MVTAAVADRRRRQVGQWTTRCPPVCPCRCETLVTAIRRASLRSVKIALAEQQSAVNCHTLQPIDGNHVEQLPHPETGHFTPEQYIEYAGFGSFQLKLSSVLGLAWLSDAMEMMLMSILSPVLLCTWRLTGLQRALLTMVSRQKGQESKTRR